MNKMSFFEKMSVFFEVAKSSNIFLFVLAILILLAFIFIKTNKHNAKKVKVVYFASTVFIIIFFIASYHGTLNNLFSYMMDNFFIAIYFPNLAIYTFALVMTNIILLISLFNYKTSKIIKNINIAVYIFMNYLLTLIISVINKNKLDIFNQASVYGNEKARALIELSSTLFVVWIIFLILYKIIIIYLKKEYKPKVKKIIVKKKVKLLPENYIPVKSPEYLYGKIPVKPTKQTTKKDLLKDYENIFTLDDYKLLSKMLKELKSNKITQKELATVINKTEENKFKEEKQQKEEKHKKEEKLIFEEPKKVDKKEETLQSYMEDFDLEEQLKAFEEKINLTKTELENPKQEINYEQSKFTELEELYRSIR